MALVIYKSSWKYKRGKNKSGKRDSDPRPQLWESCALPTELLPHFFICGAKVEYFL